MPRMLEIIGGHDQAKSFLRTDVSKVLKKSRINCGESQIFVSRVIGPDHLGFTREIQICDSPQLMPRMLEMIGGHDQATECQFRYSDLTRETLYKVRGIAEL